MMNRILCFHVGVKWDHEPIFDANGIC